MTTDDLVPQVLAAIEETEQMARLVPESRREWRIGGIPYEGYLVMDSKGARVVFSKQLGVDYHIARNDPAAVLRRCAADRRRLERHQPRTAAEGPYLGKSICVGCSVGDDEWFDRPFPCPDFLDLADSYGVAPATEPADRQEGN